MKDKKLKRTSTSETLEVQKKPVIIKYSHGEFMREKTGAEQLTVAAMILTHGRLKMTKEKWEIEFDKFSKREVK